MAVAKAYPERFVGSVVEDDPQAPPSLLIKGTTTEAIGKLVEEAPIEVRILDEQRFSYDELSTRNQRVAKQLQDAGYPNLTVGSDIRNGGRLQISLQAAPELSSDVGDILNLLSPQDREGSPVVTVSANPVTSRDVSFGGMRNGLAPNSPWCTAGFSVEDGNGVDFATTAGHCGDDIDRVTHPGVWDHGWTFEDTHEGTWGDVSIFDSWVEATPEFYATTTIIRDVTSVESVGGFSLGEDICIFSRVRGVGDCAEVSSTSICNTDMVKTWCSLVQLDEDLAWGGDSGTVWYWHNKAYGIDHASSCGGNCTDPNGTSLLSVADRFDEALGVSVRIAD